MIVIDWDQVDEWLIAGADGIEVASALGIHPDTLYMRCKKERNTDFSDYRAQKRAIGMSSLRVARYKMAVEDRHPTMMIWLSKQMLNETDKPAPAPVDTNYTVEIVDPKKDADTGDA